MGMRATWSTSSSELASEDVGPIGMDSDVGKGSGVGNVVLLGAPPGGSIGCAGAAMEEGA